MKSFLFVAAAAVVILNLWVAPTIYRLSKTKMDDPTYSQSQAKIKRLEKISRGSALVFFAVVLAGLASGIVSVK